MECGFEWIICKLSDSVIPLWHIRLPSDLWDVPLARIKACRDGCGRQILRLLAAGDVPRLGFPGVVGMVAW